MWPKALAQLIELLPHITRLVPAADRFLTQRSGTDASTQRAMDAMAEGLRGDLGQVTAAHAGLYAKIEAQSEAVALATAEAAATRAAVESAHARLSAVEKRLSQLHGFAIATFLLALAAVALIVFLLFRAH